MGQKVVGDKERHINVKMNGMNEVCNCVHRRFVGSRLRSLSLSLSPFNVFDFFVFIFLEKPRFDFLCIYIFRKPLQMATADWLFLSNGMMTTTSFR